jgi:hypothetical protein
MHALGNYFPRYQRHNPLVPVYCVSHSDKPSIHRFFDTSPVSPSGRFLAVTEFPFEDRVPTPGDHASVVVVDLHTGEETFRSATSAWDTQLGAQAQWGNSDSELFFNRMDYETWTPYGVKVDISTGTELRLEQTIYMVSHDGRHALSPCLRRISHVQPGYGVIVPELARPTNRGASGDDGIYITDTTTGKARLLLSLADIVTAQPEAFAELDLSAGALYGFHLKWNQQASRIMFVIRWVGDIGQRESFLITCDPHGKEIHTAIDAPTWRGGHHPNWCPDGTHIVMNLVERRTPDRLSALRKFLEKAARKVSAKLGKDLRYFASDETMRFALFRYDGSERRFIGKPNLGSGHPTMSPDGAHLLTDAYPRERVAYVDGTVPLRWINLETAEAKQLVRIDATPSFNGPKSALRIDPHPTWTRDNAAIVFNGSVNGSRRVFIALMDSIS